MVGNVIKLCSLISDVHIVPVTTSSVTVTTSSVTVTTSSVTVTMSSVTVAMSSVTAAKSSVTITTVKVSFMTASGTNDKVYSIITIARVKLIQVLIIKKTKTMKAIEKMKKACLACRLVIGVVLLTIAIIPKTVIKKVIAVLNMKKLLKIGNFINKALFIVRSMTGNAWFPAPPVSLATVSTDIGNLVTAQTIALSRAKGTAQDRNDKKAIVLADLHQLLAYVQNVANLNPKNAETIIESSGFDFKLEAPHLKQAIAVKPKKGESGTMIATVKKIDGTMASLWQTSADGGRTWVSLDPTAKGRIEITGLTPGSTLMVKHLPVLRKGKGTWLISAAVVVV